jgi:glyoxylase-like metal-dependent hydrolase (beta-lactamase superfamily II)
LGAVRAGQACRSARTGPPEKRPMFETNKVDGTDNVYIFRYGNHQSMFVVTGDGVIATDPISYGRPQAAETYVAEIKKITDKPIKYLVYSHHHFDHIAGGKPFKDAGARIIAHERVKHGSRFSRIRRPCRRMRYSRTGER